MGRPGNVRITWNGPAVTAAERSGAARGLRRAAEIVAADSDRRVPRDTGELVDSRTITVDEADLHADIVYGSTGLPQAYAVRQHEDLTLEHPGGGEAKYLERALEAKRDEAMQAIAAEIKRELS